MRLIKLFGDFEIQTVHLISARRPDLVPINNNNKKNSDFVILLNPEWE